jgi:hypothetical protein
MACWTCVPPGAGLQAAINNLPNGGNLMLKPGIYMGDITISQNNLSLLGSGKENTILSGSVTVTSANVNMQDLWAYGNGKAFGMKMYLLGGGPARNHLLRVRVGGNADGTGKAPSGDGPQVGLWMDGSIITAADHCSFAFCNTGSGLFVDTTQNNLGTNCNTFRDCTFNGNAAFGVEMTDGGDGIAGMLLHRFHGGNMEDNATGEVYIKSAIGVELKGIDFESTKSLGSTHPTVQCDSCTSVLMEDCHSVTIGSSNTQRFFIFNSVKNGTVTHCRVSGLYPAGDVGAFDEGCVHCLSYDNYWHDPITGSNKTTTPRWVTNRGQMRGYTA